MNINACSPIQDYVTFFKKDFSALHAYILSVYDTLNTEKNKSLNLFTSDPEKYKDKVLASLKKLDNNTPLFGLPLVVKDNINTKDFPTSAGTAAWEHFTPEKDAAPVKLLKNAGAVIIGKTNMHELAFGITSYNAHFGSVKNPHNPAYCAGGSSGGTAAAIAAGIVSVGLGTDTGGSCRIPAALCGIFGFRPTSGRYPSQGLVPLSSTRDTPGLLARNAKDIIFLDEVITGDKTEEKLAIKTLRVGVPKAYFYDDLSPEVTKVSDRVLQKLKSRGIVLVEAPINGIPDLLSESINIVFHETYTMLNLFLENNKTGVSWKELIEKIASPDVKSVFENAVAPQPNYEKGIQTERPALQKAYQEYFTKNRVDVLLYPTTPLEAIPLEEDGDTILLNGKHVPTFGTYIRNMNPGSYAGIPGISIPAGKSKNELPIGMHLEGPQGKDRKLLQTAILIDRIINES